jgi:enamine deaminase RidA (YjgF/YER057c/UK114 family)
VSTIERRLEELGLRLPKPMAPPPGHAFPFVLVRVSGGQAYASGHGPADGTEYLMHGKVGDALSVEQGYEAARMAALSMLAALKETLGDLDRIAGWLRAVGYVNCTPGFPDTFLVVNGFSDLIVEIWGDAGRHARAAPGVAALPFNIPIVVEATVELASEAAP